MAWPDFSDMRSRVRDLLRESSAGFYTDAEINRWLNDGERDVAIKGLCIETINSAATVSGSRTVAKPYNKCLYVEYIPGSGAPRGLVKITPLHLGHVQNNGITPQYWFPWGRSIGIEPKPTAAYNLNIYASILPSIEMTDDTDEPQVPRAFIPLIVRYAFCRGLLKSFLFTKGAHVYADYITQLQIARDSVIRKYRNEVVETVVPDTTATPKA
jgi:hypothetical protein